MPPQSCCFVIGALNAQMQTLRQIFQKGVCARARELVGTVFMRLFEARVFMVIIKRSPQGGQEEQERGDGNDADC